VKKILIILAHPKFESSKMNKTLIEAVEGLENVTINNLYENYPDFLIDVRKEQSLCEEHDVIIVQHPFYWYSTPSIIKEWFDLVLEHDWAYGKQARALHGKIFMQSLTAGGDESSYSREGKNYFTINELTSPYAAIANLCGMSWIPPFTVLGNHRGLPKKERVKYGEMYRKVVIALREDNIDYTKVKECEYCNSDVDSIIKED